MCDVFLYIYIFYILYFFMFKDKFALRQTQKVVERRNGQPKIQYMAGGRWTYFFRRMFADRLHHDEEQLRNTWSSHQIGNFKEDVSTEKSSTIMLV
jgi:hypothetical protein